ncbi:hypothetical protein ACH5RR_040808 [Cinchona calisaya]|uniref:Uncharacterized protein n=1 Tax=Cinchona calisaya TaxID=153742 RepID=A0ABD2XTS5_9GENT
MALRREINKLTFYMIFLLLHHHFVIISSTRLTKMVHPPPAPAHILSRPKPPSTDTISFNRYKKMEVQAFRPTSPGRSPGMGHDDPPGAYAP